MDRKARRPTRRYRAVWISDVHLGFRGCSAEYLLEFLHAFECEQLYLVGDIVDIWQMKKRAYWPQAHNNVVRTILGKAKHGTRVTYIPGNHDERLREYDGLTFGNVVIENRVIHTRANGERLLIVHGDEFDAVVKCSRLTAMVGAVLYDWLLRLNYVINWTRRTLGFPYWSFAQFLKHKVKYAVQYISNFENAVAHAAAREGVEGVVCGHIHRAEITQVGEITYCNCGDWVESCTALVELSDGQLQLVRWLEERVERVPLPLAA